MIEVDAIVRKWGNSLGIIIPKELVEAEKIKENERISFAILRDSKVLKETFGLLKGKTRKTAQEIKDHTRKELYNE